MCLQVSVCMYVCYIDTKFLKILKNASIFFYAPGAWGQGKGSFKKYSWDTKMELLDQSFFQETVLALKSCLSSTPAAPPYSLLLLPDDPVEAPARVMTDTDFSQAERSSCDAVKKETLERINSKIN